MTSPARTAPALRMPEDLAAEFARLARQYGDVQLAMACGEILGRYAEAGARRAQTSRLGDAAIACERCRERDAALRVMEDTRKRAQTGRPIGGASPSASED